jgi:hypothetical protein
VREPVRLFIVIGEAALFVTCAWIALSFPAVKFAVTVSELEIFAGFIAIVPAGLAAWWLFRKLRSHYPRREARAISMAFGFLTPVTLGIGIVLGGFPGGYAETFLGNRFILVGAFEGAWLIYTALSFAACSFALGLTRQS